MYFWIDAVGAMKVPKIEAVAAELTSRGENLAAPSHIFGMLAYRYPDKRAGCPCDGRARLSAIFGAEPYAVVERRRGRAEQRLRLHVAGHGQVDGLVLVRQGRDARQHEEVKSALSRGARDRDGETGTPGGGAAESTQRGRSHHVVCVVLGVGGGRASAL